MAAGRLWPGFAPQIERLYKGEATEYSKKHVVVHWLIGVFLFDMFIASDYVLVPKDILLYATARLAVMTPVCLAVLYLAAHFRRWYNALISAMPVLMSATLAFLLMVSHGSYRSDYLFGNILVLISGCIINRSPFGYALVSVLLQCVLFHIVLFGSDIAPPGGQLLHMLFCVSGAIVAVITSYTLEKDRRRTFLLGLRVRLLNRELEVVAMTDPLTGLANRRRLAQATEHFWAKRLAAPSLASVILIDIDHFKLFNDQRGHMAGDECLKTIARRVRLHLRDGDLAVRFGGEEVLVFLPDTGFETARHVAEAICGGIRAARIPHPALGPQGTVTASLGIHTVNSRECTVKDLIALADTALYAAKAAGRDCVWPPMVATRSDHQSPMADPADVGRFMTDETRARAVA